MKSKMIITILLLVMSFPIQVCAKANETTTVTEKEMTPEEIREEEALRKVNLVVLAYHDLLGELDEFNNLLQHDEETLSYNCTDYNYITKKDGDTLNSFDTSGALIRYYYNYVNNGTGYYDIKTWIANQDSTLAIAEGVLCDSNENSICLSPKTGNFSTNYCLMCEAIGLAAYLNQFGELTLGEFVESPEWTPSQLKCAYGYQILCDGDYTGLTAVFDEEGNMLNICSTDEFTDYIYTFRPDLNGTIDLD